MVNHSERLSDRIFPDSSAWLCAVKILLNPNCGFGLAASTFDQILAAPERTIRTQSFMKYQTHILGALTLVAIFLTADAYATTIVVPPPARTTAPTTVVVPTAPSVAPTQTAQPTSYVLPAGTQLLVRLTDPVSSSSAPGTRFATTLDHDLTAPNGAVVLKAGTVIYGTVASSSQARRVAGQSSYDLRLTQINAGAQQIPISTTGVEEMGERSGRKAARGAGLGAGIGALAGNAGAGAAAGAIAGGARRPQSVGAEPGQLLQFTLTQPATITH
jgi:hypothetical protein